MLRFLLACVFISVGQSLAQAPVIEISGANFRPMPLAYPAALVTTSDARAAAAEFDGALSFDLGAAGIFQLLDRKGFLASSGEGLDAKQIAFRRWQDVGAEALVKAQFSVAGGQLVAEVRAYTVQNGREDFRRTEKAPISEARVLAHRVADLLYTHYTREPGPFASRLAYVKRQGPHREVWVSDWDAKRAVRVAWDGMHLIPAWVPGQPDVAYTSYRRQRPELFVQRPGGPPRPLVESATMVTGATFSPDGRRLAFSKADEGGAVQVYVANADGSDARKVTDSPYFINTSPSWSPDGRQLAFVSNRGGSPQVYTMGADGTGVRRRTFRGNYNQTPDWSPRGDLIAFTARDERNAFDIFTVHVDTGEVTRLTQDQGNNEEPAFAPNGRLIVFTSTRLGGPRLFVMTLDGSSQMALPTEPGTYTTPDWAR
ncbi:MAG: translocation protein TolB [Myxococcaceae bacterium]